MTDISKRQRAWFYIYKKQKRCETFIYIQKSQHFSKSETISATFLYAKITTLYVTRFFIKIWGWYLNTKIMTLCVTWYCYLQKSRYFAKTRQFALRFYIQNVGHFALHFYTVWLKWMAMFMPNTLIWLVCWPNSSDL